MYKKKMKLRLWIIDFFFKIIIYKLVISMLSLMDQGKIHLKNQRDL